MVLFNVEAGPTTTAEERRSSSGIWLPLIPGVTPNVAKDAEWRAQSAWSYSGIAADTPAPDDLPVGSLALLGVGI